MAKRKKKNKKLNDIRVLLVPAIIFILVILGYFIFLTIKVNESTPEVYPRKPIAGAIYNGSREKKNIAITFDADLTPIMKGELDSGRVKSFYDKKIIKVLEQNSTPATIFVTGLWAETYTKELKEISSNKLFEIENHSYNHGAFKTPCFNLKKVKNKQEEITKAEDVIKNITGQAPRFFRFPGGCFTKKDVALVNKLGLEVVDWDVVSGDPYLTTNKEISNRIIENTKNGSIIIMHLSGVKNVSDTEVALSSAIKSLKKKGFNFVKVSDLLGN